MEQYLNLKEKSNHLTIYKLRNNVKITQAELDDLDRMLFEQGDIETKEEFVKVYGEKPLCKFVRSILGLDINAAKQAFGEILNNQTLKATQIRFINTIINYLSVNGIIDPAKLFESSFTDVSSSGMDIFDTPTSSRIIQLIEWINKNAEVA